MKKFKRSVALILAVLMIVTTMPISTFTMTANAASDKYYSKYGITYNQLFTLYPQYLSPDAEHLIVSTLTERYHDVLDSYNGSDDFIASYMYSLKNGINILGREVLAGFGLTQSTKEIMMSDTSELLMQNICNTNKAMTSAASEVSDNFKHMKNVYTTTTTMGKVEFIDDLKAASNNLSDEDIDKLADELFENSGNLMKIAGTGIEYWQLIVGIIEMQEIQEEVIYRLLNALPANSSLADALIILLEDMDKDIVEHVFDHYCTDKSIELISDAIKTTINGIANDTILPGAIATTLGKLIVSVFTDYIYQGAMADDIVQTTYLSTYVTELEMAVMDYKVDFMLADSVKTTTISEYEFIYSSYIVAIRTALESSLKMAKSKEEKSLVQSAISICNSYTYDKYIEFCMQELKDDIAAGKVKAPANASEGSNIKVTEEESRISIQEKFRQLQAQYPPNQGVTWFGNYGGAIQCFGFVRMAFNKIFDCDMPAWYHNEKRYEYGNNQNVVVLGQLNGSAEMTEANVKNLLSNALVGDVIQACGSYSQHTMMVVSADENGVTVYECNHAGECGIYQRTISYTSFAASYGTPHAVGGCGVTLYRAANYDSLYWDGSAVFYDDSVNFVIDENGVLTKYNGWQRYVTIPEEVTAIGDNAFNNNDKIVRVTMTDNVKSIGYQSFSDCDNLYFVEFSNALESIGNYAFYSCDNYSSAPIPNTVTSIGSYAFKDCISLNDLSLPTSVSVISYATFSGCENLRTVLIPDNVVTIESFAFYQCVKLDNIVLSKNLATLGGSVFTNTAIKEITIPKSLQDCSVIVEGAYTTDSSYQYSYTLNGNQYSVYGGPFSLCENLKTINFEDGITNIANNLFNGAVGIEEVVIPESVTSIESRAFEGCLRLESATLSDNITSIGTWAFNDCYNLVEINLPKALTSLGGSVFTNTAIEEITIPKSLQNCSVIVRGAYTSSSSYQYSYTLGNKQYNVYGGPFSLCENLKTVNFEKGITVIPSNVFNGAVGIEEVVIPDTVTSIESRAFEGCLRLESATLSENIKNIDSWAFNDCFNLVEVNLPKSLTTLGGSAFTNTAIEKITVPKSLQNCSVIVRGAYTSTSTYQYSYTFNDEVYYVYGGPFSLCEQLKTIEFESGITKIPDNLFNGSIGIEEIVIPDTVTSINSRAFEGCIRLKNLTFGKTVSTIDDRAFQNCASISSITIPETISSIGDYSFADCQNLTAVVIPNSVIDMGKYSFDNCSLLNEVKLPTNRINITEGTFRNCIGLKTIEIPDSVEAIRNNAFSGCISLESVVFSERSNLSEIENNAFYDCSALKEMILPEKVSTIGNYAFQNCIALEKVYIPQSTKDLGTSAFQGCELLSDLTIADYGVKEIKSYTFKGCPALVKVTLPKGLTKIGAQAFMNDTGLIEITIPESVTSIDATAFSYPDKMAIFGMEGSYAETFANENNFLFNDNTIPAQGLSLIDGVDYIVMDRGETYRAKFEFYPEDATDVVTLTADNTKVTINGHDISARSTGDTVITATATSGVTYQFTIHIRDAKKITVSQNPDKMSYIMGDEMDLTGLKLQVEYYDGSVREITDYTVTGFDSSVEGQNIITIKWISAYGTTYSTTVTFEIIDPRPKLTGVVIDTLPDKIVYERREPIDLTGMVVEATYTDGSSVEITDYTVSGYNALKNGVQTITISYNGFTTTFTVTVGQIPDHAHSYTVPKYDVNGHWNECECGVKDEVNQHSYENACDKSCDCGYTRIVPAHDYSDATCTAPKTCTICGATDGETLGHIYDKQVVSSKYLKSAASCSSAAVYYKSCECGAKGTTTFTSGSKLSHKSDSGTVTKKATCTATGTKTYKCTLCKATIKTETIAKVVHKYDSGKVTTAATCKATGVKTYTCSVCKGTKTETIAKLTTHTYSNNCDKSCNVCGKTRTVGAHKYSNNCDTTCNYCSAKRTIKHTYSNNCDTSCNVCKATRTITHAYKTTTTKATLSKNGSVVKKCTVCGKVASNTAIKYAKTFKLSTTTYTYDGKVKTPSVTVKDSAGKTLKKNTDYTVTYASGRKNAGTYKVTIKMKGNYTGTKTLTFKIKPAKLSSFKLSDTSYTYNGKTKTPSVTVKNANGTKMTENKHYTVTYSSGRKNVGTYEVTIKGKGNYTGTKTLTFKINPTKTKVSKLTTGKKKITVAITKKSTQVTGYQIQYSTSKKFTNAKTKTISSYKTTKYTLKSLSAKKTYYVRVRTYKTVGKTKYYSGWSTYKYVKTK